jgi:preprotein translocase, SecE subunit, bacterial
MAKDKSKLALAFEEAKENAENTPKKRRSIGKWFGGLFHELGRLVWPTPKEGAVLVLTVLGVIVAVGAFVWGLDFGLNFLIVDVLLK